MPRPLRDLYPYQKLGIRWLYYRTIAFVTLRMGFGKTAIAAIVAGRLMRKGKVKRVLVVGTKNIVEMTWPDELREWEYLCQFSFASATGTLARRIKAVEGKPDFLLISYDHLAWFMNTYYGSDFMPEMVIYDESTCLKNSETKRVKAVRDRTHAFKRRVNLTATPAPESYADLYGQAACIDPKRRGMGKNITAFRAKYCSGLMLPHGGIKYHIGEMAQRDIEHALAPITFNLEAEEHIGELAEAQIIDVPVHWRRGDRERYDEMERDSVLRFLDEHGRALKIEAANVGVMQNKLRQMCAGVIYKDGIPVGLDETKLEALDDALLGLAGRSALVFYAFTWERDEMLKRYGKNARALKSKSDLEDFDAGKFQYLILHPASAGHGLNLHRNCSDAIFYSLPWGSEKYLQSIGRLRAHLNARQVIIYRLMRDGPCADWDVSDKLEGKLLTLAEYVERVGYRHRKDEAP